MIKLLGSLPRNLTVAVSGGVDSMVAAKFLANNHNVRLAFFDHGTETSKQALEFLTVYAEQHKLELTVGRLERECPKGISPEEHWRNQRYWFLDSLRATVVTAHNLDDCVETWIWSSLNGTPKLIPCKRNRVIRPFLLTAKKQFIDWAIRHSVPWIEDQTNQDVKYMRNYVRHNLMPHALHVNPGLHKMIAKRIKEKYQDEKFN